MNKLTIIADDKAVYVDGASFSNLDLSTAGIPADVHALQWNATNNAGWIEFLDDQNGHKPANEAITALPAWATACVAIFNAKVAADAAAAAEAAAKAAANQPKTVGTTTV